MSFKETKLGLLPRSWEISSMEEALGQIIDYRGKTPKKSESGIATLSAKSVKNGYIDYSNAYFISEEEYERFMVRGFPKKGDILMTTEAPIGYVAKLDNDKVGIAQRLLTLRGKENYLENNYLMYYLMSAAGQHQLLSRASGTTVTGIKQSEFRKVLISIPPIEEQKAIAKVLSDLDEKIETNNKINKKLEEMARAIFKQWFIDFEFPNEKGKPYKSSGGEMVESELRMIPKGWKVVTLGDYIQVKHGYAFKSKYFSDDETSNILLTPGNFKIGGGFYDKKFKYYLDEGEIKEEYILNEDDLIITMTDLSKDGDTLGYPAIVPKIRDKRILHNQRLGKIEIINKEISKEFIYYLMCNPYYRYHILATATGTIVRHTAPKRVTNYKFALPNDFKIFNELICSYKKILKRTNYILNENRCLIGIRNSLLPKLMSGEIRVPLNNEEI